MAISNSMINNAGMLSNGTLGLGGMSPLQSQLANAWNPIDNQYTINSHMDYNNSLQLIVSTVENGYVIEIRDYASGAGAKPKIRVAMEGCNLSDEIAAAIASVKLKG